MPLDDNEIHERAHMAHMHVTALLTLLENETEPSLDAINYCNNIKDVRMLRTALYAAAASLHSLSKHLPGGSALYLSERAAEINDSYSKGPQ